MELSWGLNGALSSCRFPQLSLKFIVLNKGCRFLDPYVRPTIIIAAVAIVGSRRHRLPPTSAATSSSRTDSMASGLMPLPNNVQEIIFEHSDPATLLSLRRVCHRFKQAADISFTITSHLPMPEERYESDEIGPDGEISTREFTRRELATSTIHYGKCQISMTLEEGWSIDLTSLEAAITRTLDRADPGGQVSWAEYDEEKARKLMSERRWVDVEDFASDCEEGGASDREWKSESEIGWRVTLADWTKSCSSSWQVVRDSVWHVVRDYGADEDVDSDEDVGGEGVYRKGAGVNVSILRRVWGLLVEQPQLLVYVRIVYEYRHTEHPSGGTDEYVNIRTSKGEDYQLHKDSHYMVL